MPESPVNQRDFDQHVYQDSARLDRIEAKIDRMSEVVIQMAKAEEKLVSLENDKKFLLERIMKHDEMLVQLAQDNEKQKTTLASITKLLWAFVTATLTAIAGLATTILK